MNTLPRTFDRAIAELGLSGPVYRVEEGGDGTLTLHLPTGAAIWRPGKTRPEVAPAAAEGKEDDDFTAIPYVGEEIARALHAAGFATFDDLVRAPDPALLDVASVSGFTLKKIRTYLAEHYL